MFNDLFWALYFIDVLSNFPGRLVGGALIITAVCAIALIPFGMINGEMEESGAPKKTFTSAVKLWVALMVLVVFIAFIPSKQTMYMMLGVRATENFTQTEMGKKLEAYINGQMDEFLNKGKAK